MTSAYTEAGKGYFVLSAGSTTHGSSGSESDEDAPVIVDGGNGYGSVEIEITIDRPTLFTMTRSIERSRVSFWSNGDLLDSLDYSDDRTALRAGTYWVSIETDEYGTPVWAEVDVWQQEKDPADLNDDGKVDQKDLSKMVSLMSKTSKDKPSEDKGSKKKPSYPTGGTCTDGAQAKGKGKTSLISKDSPIYGKPLPRPKPGSFGSDKDKNKGAQSKADFDQPSDFSHHEFDFSDNSSDSNPIAIPSKGKKAPKSSKPIEIDLSETELKGDLNGDKKVNFKDLFILLERL
jgi:hypothetical protein